MTRGFPSRPVFSAALAMLMLTSISLTAFVAPTSAEPSQETASNSVSISNSITSPADEGSGPRFPFSVLDQATTTITKTICPTPGNCASGGTTATLTPGSVVSFLVVVANAQGPSTFTDQWSAGLVFQNGDGCGAVTPNPLAGLRWPVTCTNSQAILNFLVSTTATTPSTATNQATIGGAPALGGDGQHRRSDGDADHHFHADADGDSDDGCAANSPAVSGTPGIGCATVDRRDLCRHRRGRPAPVRRPARACSP